MLRKKTNKILLGISLCLIIAVSLSVVYWSKREESRFSYKSDRVLTINIQPLDGIKNVDKTVADFKKHYLIPLGLDSCRINILPHRTSPDSAYNGTRMRYRAVKLVNYLHDNTAPGEFTIGITDKDISTSIHGSDDYGILGLAFRGNYKRACITSTYRLKYRKDLWKLMAHEFTHGFFSMGHCKLDDVSCIMHDAKGKSPKFEIKEYLCNHCRQEIDRKLGR